MRGGSTQFRLEEPTQTKTATGADSTTWSTVATFTAHIQPLTTSERELYMRDGVLATHRIHFFLYELGTNYVTSMIAKNRVVALNKSNELAEQVYDITGVHPYRTRSGLRIHHFEVELKVVT